MEEHYEVPPANQRVVWLNGQHMKPMLAFEALTRALGWGYNHHKPQVVWQQDCSVRLEVPKVRRVRGHTSHAHPQTTPTAINTHVQMGTYLSFYLQRRSSIERCYLVLDGLEAVRPREAAKAATTDDTPVNKILITRLAEDGHTLEYPKGASHDETQATAVEICCRTPTTLGTPENLSRSPTKLSVAGKTNQMFSPGKLTRTNNKQQSRKASKSSRSYSRRKRHLRLTPASNTTDDTCGNNNTTSNADTLRPDGTTGEEGEDNATALTSLDTLPLDFAEQKPTINHSLRPPSYVDDIAQVSDRLSGVLNNACETLNWDIQTEASKRTESSNGYTEGNETHDVGIADKMEKRPDCSNELDLGREISKKTVSNGDSRTETSHYPKLNAQDMDDLTNGSGSNRAACRSSLKTPCGTSSSGGPFRDSVGVSDVWSFEADLSSPDEVTAILSGSDSDGNDEWEDEDDEDIYKVVRKCISTDITALLHRHHLTSLIEASNGINDTTDLKKSLLDRDHRLSNSTNGYHNNINKGTVLGNTENRSASSTGVATDTRGDKSQERRGSLEPEQLTSEHRTQGLRRVGNELVTSNGDEKALGTAQQNGEEDRITCENMIKSYEQKIQLSKMNSNQHARASHLIEEIIENRWRETKLKKISSNTNLNINVCLNKRSVGSSDINSTPHHTTGQRINPMVDALNSDNTRVDIRENKLDTVSENLQNGGSLRDQSSSIASPSPTLVVSSPSLAPGRNVSWTPSLDHEEGELLVLLLRPRTPQQAWQFQSAHLTVWYKSKDKQRPSNEGAARRPPRRTRLTYRTVTRPPTRPGASQPL